MKHTPGQWKATDQGSGPRGKSLGFCVTDSRGLPLFFLPRGTPQHEANARLIAAAPDLMESLSELLDVLEVASFNNREAWIEFVNEIAPPSFSSILSLARAAVTKAAGGDE